MHILNRVYCAIFVCSSLSEDNQVSRVHYGVS